ncbi:MAG: glycosyltransferase family 4 protein [Candidatus Zambryskibacteria bacterium]
MKVCYLIHDINPVNGGGRLVFELVKNLDKDIVTEIKFLTQINSSNNAEETILPNSIAGLIFSLPKIRNALKKYDIIHAFDVFPYGIITAIALIGLKKKFIITVVGSGSVKPLHSFWRLWFSEWALKKADKIISISSYTAEEIEKKVSDVEIDIINPGVDYDYFNNLPKDNSFTDTRPYILSVGAIKSRKGYEISLRVFAEINASLPQLKYIIVGAGRDKYFEKLKNLIKELHIEEKVVFKKDISREELVSLYKGAELFLLLSQNDNYDVEGFGLVFLEAAACGLPVIGSTNCGAEDAIWNGGNGFLVDPKNISKAKKYALIILKNFEMKYKFKDKSLEFARKMSWQNAAQKYLNIYKELS